MTETFFFRVSFRVSGRKEPKLTFYINHRIDNGVPIKKVKITILT